MGLAHTGHDGNAGISAWPSESTHISLCGFLEENSIKESIFCMFRMLPGYKSRVYFAAVILEVFNIHHKKLLFEFCLQRRLRMQTGD